MTGLIQVITTFGDRHACEQAAAVLVDEKLAACVQVRGPIQSFFRWEGKLEHAEEWVVVAKTAAGMYERVERRIRDLHPYDEPEIIAVPIVRASAGYSQWVLEEVDLPVDLN